MAGRRKMIRAPAKSAKYGAAYRKGLANKAKMARQPFTERVQSAILRAQETKFKIAAPYNYNTGATLEAFTQFSTAITSTVEAYSLIPPVNVGDDDFERIGNVIQPTSLTTKIQCALGGTASTRVYVDFWFLKSQNIKDGKRTADLPIQKLMNDGGGLNVPYDGTSYTAMMPINKSEFTVISHKRIMLKKGNNDNNTLYSGGTNPAIESSPSFKSFSVKIPLPKRLTYEQKGDNIPSNVFPFLVIGFYAADQFGDTALTPALPLYVQAQSHLFYKDA